MAFDFRSSSPIEIGEVAPSVAGSDVSDESRLPLQWVFHGLTLWLEFEEFESDLHNAIQHASDKYGTEVIPQPHATAIYGMTHLSEQDASRKLHELPSRLTNGWPRMDRPVGIKQDIAQEGRPGQVCTIAWAELTLATNEKHEAVLDQVYELFDMGPRKGPWTPHLSLAYDNPDDTTLSLGDFLHYVADHPTLLRPRKVTALSLWNTEGKMADWKCLDRVHFDRVPVGV